MNESMNSGNAVPKKAKEHPAIELEEVVENIQSLDEQRASLLEQREAEEKKAWGLIQEIQEATESALITLAGPPKEDVNEDQEHWEHWESVRERRLNGA